MQDPLVPEITALTQELDEQVMATFAVLLRDGKSPEECRRVAVKALLLTLESVAVDNRAHETDSPK